ncbi:DUF4025 domain-containing protein [Bacillus pseudomycoides]|uniref:DUF4025 domain-containing protein n=1 Tax=Bacillus pseudomycoides TaxID=64104 RepID=UPI000BF7EDDD|nr:DUF4025 domain-containing protein [Bacillus pseudomycoides]PFW87846.1 DUF4025 domain-containing protein [Bacillus pseudomycoides]PFX41418.1 DUF4025 domain-containing protein [Bacillus pseudomycoides]
MVKQNNKQSMKVTNQSYTSQTKEEVDSVVQEQISDTVAEGTIDAKLGKQSSEEQ